jgi:ATP-binding cassette, subfamily F, member 3
MISISLSKIRLVLGSHTIINDLFWDIQQGQKIGLVGANGAGKSSLFKLIIGEYSPEPGGKVIKAKDITVGYLPQQPDFPLTETAYELALAGIPRVAEIETALGLVEEKLAQPEVFNNPKSLDRVLETQEKLIEEYELYGGVNYPLRVKDTLYGLGLTEPDFYKPVNQLSGGQKKLVGLTRLLLARPDVLLLDEPDNHLDIPGKIYLERLILDYPGAVILISHDRTLLDACVTNIAEIEDGRLTTFNGSYTEFIIDKEEKLARQEELYQIQQRSIKRMEMALKRYQLWVKVSDKFASRVRSMQTRLSKVDKLNQPLLDRHKMGLELNGWRGSNQVLELINVSKAFPPRILLDHTNFLIRHGERVGLIGANGSGKSILLKLILGLEQPDSGEVKIGPSVRVGYYAQEHDTLDQDRTVIDTVRLGGNISEARSVSILTRYLFTYQQATQKVRELSGGEKSRLQLALLVLSGANFLLLDEPTNNLDIASAEVLENSLTDFIGTVLVISHDRYFLDRTVDRILELEDSHLSEYIGGYSDYVQKSGKQQ